MVPHFHFITSLCSANTAGGLEMPRGGKGLVQGMLGSQGWVHMSSSWVSRPGPELFPLLSSCEDQKGNWGLSCHSSHMLFYPAGARACPPLTLASLGHPPDGQERVKGMVWASYKFPISVGRAGLLAGRGLGWGRGSWEKAPPGAGSGQAPRAAAASLSTS